MKIFHCAGCGMMIFFENHHCLKCGRELGFLPDSMVVEALAEIPGGRWTRLAAGGDRRSYRKCQNEIQHKVCNWMIPAEDENMFCSACNLNEIIPNLSASENFQRWRKLEAAKKRCVYTLKCLGLSTDGVPAENRAGLHFRFLENNAANAAVTTGHQAGVITVNIAEADDDERERRRLLLHEPHRTLIGHLRHELGHYYWDRLIANSGRLDRFRELFGDERADYPAALQNYYRLGPAGNWSARTVTAYASAHPWEDWAETWAHYLHIYDTLETAGSFGLEIAGTGETRQLETRDFDAMFARWIPLSCALNSINRGMGLADLYPFVIPAAALEKLRFVHAVIGSNASGNIADNMAARDLVPVTPQTACAG